MRAAMMMKPREVLYFVFEFIQVTELIFPSLSMTVFDTQYDYISFLGKKQFVLKNVFFLLLTIAIMVVL